MIRCNLCGIADNVLSLPQSRPNNMSQARDLVPSGSKSAPWLEDKPFGADRSPEDRALDISAAHQIRLSERSEL